MYSKVLKDDLHTSYGWANKKVTIKKGAYVYPATNLAEGGFWVVVDSSYSDEVKSWAHHYGFRVGADDTMPEIAYYDSLIDAIETEDQDREFLDSLDH